MDNVKNLRELASCLPKMLSGEDLKNRLECLPCYDEGIRRKSPTDRLVALNSLYDVYIPSAMGREIYSRLYLAALRSLQKKGTKLFVRQQNINGKTAQGCMDAGSPAINAGDSFTIIGSSGIGKSSSIAKAVEAFDGNRVMEVEEPFCRIVPAICIQTPFDASVKSLLLSVLRQVDICLGSHYYDNAVKARATTDMLIGSVSQVCLNHVCLLVVDEIQNVIRNRKGAQLVGALTQLINNSGISVCMVGVPEVETFFEQADYFGRRALGLRYGRMAYDELFRGCCETLFSCQYVQERTELDEGTVNWLYGHSGGTVALLVTLIHDAQEISILNGHERLDLASLNMAYEERMGAVHTHIKPVINIMRKSAAKKASAGELAEGRIHSQNPDSAAGDFSLTELAQKARKENLDMVELLKGRISITEIAV